MIPEVTFACSVTLPELTVALCEMETLPGYAAALEMFCRYHDPICDAESVAPQTEATPSKKTSGNPQTL